MRDLQPDLLARLAAGATTLCTCWTVQRRDGAILGFTDHDEVVDLDGLLCTPASALASSALETTLGLAPGNGEVAGALISEAISESDIASGRYDGAAVERWLVDWTATGLRVLLFRGSLGEIVREGASFRAEVLGLSSALNQPIGRVFQPRCDARLGDTRCGVDVGRAGLSGSATVLASDGRRLLLAGLDDVSPGWLAGGKLDWLTGASAGRSAGIAADVAKPDGRALTLSGEADDAGSVGDTVRVTVGCDGCLETCANRFGNAVNFRGFPHMPGDAWALAPYPAPDGRHDGGSL